MSTGARIAIRLGLVAWSIGVVAWASLSLSASRGEAELGAVSARIVAGEPFKAEKLIALEPRIVAVEAAKMPKPAVLRSAAIIRLRLAELELDAGHPLSHNETYAQAEAAIRTALTVMPTDSFLWFGLSWLIKTRDGFQDALVPLLRMSYDTGEHEGWVAVHRNALADSILPELPTDLQDRVVAEFRDLVTSNYIPAAAGILTGPGWSQRNRLAAGLAAAPEDDRRRFSRAVRDLGYDVDIPGISLHPDRPWR